MYSNIVYRRQHGAEDNDGHHDCNDHIWTVCRSANGMLENQESLNFATAEINDQTSEINSDFCGDAREELAPGQRTCN